MRWAVVLFRLLCPTSFSTDFSLLGIFHSPAVTNGSITYIPTDIVHTANPQVDLPLPGISQIINETLPQGDEQTVADPLEAPMAIATFLWLFGIAAMLIYSIVSVLILKNRLKSARYTKRNIYEADNLKTPFVLGIFSPRIYIPAGLTEEEKSYIIRHEQTHIRRFDHIIKPFAFLVLSIHWFNPLVWIAFILMGTDMELSCDERVLKEMGGDIKKAYSTSLLLLATEKRILNGSPLAFGEGNVGGRIKNVLNYKKPAFWMIGVAVVAVIAVGIGLAINPSQKVSLMDNSVFSGETQLDKTVSVTINGPQGDQTASATITRSDGNFGWKQLLAFLPSVEVEQKEINQSRTESRDKSWQIIFDRQINGKSHPVAFYFSRDFEEVWIDDNIKPSYSHQVINPDAVSAYLPVFFASLSPQVEPALSAEPLIFSSGETD